MTFNLFKKCVDEIAEENLAGQIHFYGSGEAYLCPEHMKYFNYGIEKLAPLGVRTTIITNGMLVTDIPKNIHDFIISFNAGRKETYQRLTGLDFDRTVNNIRRLYEEGQFENAENVEVHMLVHEKNVDEVDDFVKLFKPFNIRMRLAYKFDNQRGLIPDWTVEKFRTTKRFPCHYVLNVLYVTWNGEVSLCAHDFDNEVVYGDANTESLVEIWRSPLRAEMVLRHRQGRFEGLCENCNFNTSFDGKYFYVEGEP